MSTKKVGISFGALAPPLIEQLHEQGLTMDAKDASALSNDIDAVNRLYLRNVITETEAKQARRRIMKKITAKVSSDQPKEHEEIPFTAFGPDDLGEPVRKGELIDCPSCGGQHEVRCGTDANTGEESPLLQFYTCGEKSYLCGIKGQRLD